MNRSVKEAVVASLRESFSKNPASFLVTVKGLSVDQLEALRSKLREKQGLLHIAKVRLMKRALEDAKSKIESMAHFESYMKNQVGLIFAQSDPLEIAKVICDFSKENEALQVVAGAMDSDVLDAKMVRKIAALPSKKQLLAQLASCLAAPMTTRA